MDLSFFVIPKILGLNGLQNYRRKINLRCKIVKNKCKIDYKRWKIIKKLLFYDFPYTILVFSCTFLYACTVFKKNEE